MSKSQYSNEDGITSEIQLADSGYGQGQILMNPLHLACIYSAFIGDGNMIKPYLEMTDNKTPEYWIAGAFSKEAAAVIKEDLTAVIEDENGTGTVPIQKERTWPARREPAEIKASQDDEMVRSWMVCRIQYGWGQDKQFPDAQHGGGCERPRRKRLCGGSGQTTVG